jgi:peptidoglycan hydrolase-like protein with peptidoglycan-binding domain
VLGAIGFLCLRLCARAVRRPIDSAAIVVAVVATVVIVVNAVFLQSGTHPAPFFANPARRPAVTAAQAKSTLISAVRHHDPIADLIGPSPRIAALQRALSDYGFGQIKATGTTDPQTSAAIEKFERARNMPITGQVSDRLIRELTAMTGRPLE